MADRALFGAVVALFTVSLVMIYSLSTYATLYYGYNEFHFFLRQLIAVLLGIAILVGLSWLDPDRWFVPLGFAIFFLSFLAMLAMPFLPASLVKAVLEAKRWIHLGPVSLAPVEFFKVGFVFSSPGAFRAS